MNILEVIVVNDGSKVIIRVDAFQKQYPQTFHVINKENGSLVCNSWLLKQKESILKFLMQIIAGFSQYLEKIKTLDVNNIFKGKIHFKPESKLRSGLFLFLNIRIYNFFSFHFSQNAYYCISNKKLHQIGYWQTEGILIQTRVVFSPISTVHNAYYCPRIFISFCSRRGKKHTNKNN